MRVANAPAPGDRLVDVLVYYEYTYSSLHTGITWSGQLCRPLSAADDDDSRLRQRWISETVRLHQRWTRTIVMYLIIVFNAPNARCLFPISCANTQNHTQHNNEIKMREERKKTEEDEENCYVFRGPGPVIRCVVVVLAGYNDCDDRTERRRHRRTIVMKINIDDG